MRIQVPAGRELQFFDARGRPLDAPQAVHLAREIELPDDVGIPASPRTETPAQVVANRVGVTGALFATAMGVALVLGRPRS